MRYLSMFLTALVLSGINAQCEPQSLGSKSAKADENSVFSPFPASTATPVKPSLAVLARWKSLGDLTVPFDNDNPGRPVFSPDGKWIAAPGRGWTGNGPYGKGRTRESGLVFLWDARTRVLMKKLEVPKELFNGYLGSLIWSPDCKQIAAWQNGFSSPIFVWDVDSGSLQFSVPNEKLTVASAFYSNDGEVSAIWFDDSISPSKESYLSIGRGEKRKINLNGRAILHLLPLKKESPLALVLEAVREVPGDETLLQTSLCWLQNGRLGPPLIKFAIGEVMLTMESSRDERTIILSGIKQPTGPNQETGALYAVCDLNKRQILWKTDLEGTSSSTDLSISPDGQQFWAQTHFLYGHLRFDTRTGAVTTQKYHKIPYFSPDGKRAVQRLNKELGQKPYRPIFHLFER